MNGKDFFENLKQKLAKKPSSGFDSQFWARFDKEFGQSQKSSMFGWRLIFSPAGMLAAASLAGIIFLTRIQNDNQNQQQFYQVTRELLHYTPDDQELLLSNIELLGEFDELAIEDNEWNVLLEEKGS